jgi:hypothetical protein
MARIAREINPTHTTTIAMTRTGKQIDMTREMARSVDDEDAAVPKYIQGRGYVVVQWTPRPGEIDWS